MLNNYALKVFAGCQTLKHRLASDVKGLTMVEYAVMCSLIAAALITLLVTLSGTIQDEFTRVNDAIKNN